MGTDKQQKRDRDATRAYTISRSALIVSCLALGWQVYQSFAQKRNYGKEFGNIESSLRLLTATVAPQLLQAVDENLRAALSETPTQPAQTSQALAKVETDTANLRKLKATLPAQQINQTSALLEKAVSPPRQRVGVGSSSADGLLSLRAS
jgi:hypothetical protein